MMNTLNVRTHANFYTKLLSSIHQVSCNKRTSRDNTSLKFIKHLVISTDADLDFLCYDY